MLPLRPGSWLNMAEIEITILDRNALPRRLPDEATLRCRVGAVETERNPQRTTARDCLAVHVARCPAKLERLYLVNESSGK